MSQTQRTLELNGRKITLLGTAHISKESVDEVEQTIRDIKPDCVAVELDDKRADSIKNKESYRQLDIVKVLRQKQGFLMLANLILSSFQRRMGQNTGVKPGDEMLAAMNAASELNVPCVLVDRPIQTTLRRAWAKNSFWGKMNLLALLLSSAFSKEEISSEEVEKLKNGNEMDSMMSELAESLPVVKEVLIDERDRYLAAKIWSAGGSNLVAVLGAGHLPGVTAWLEKLAAGEVTAEVQDICEVPQKRGAGKFIAWLIPALIIAMLVAGFFLSGKKDGIDNILTWIIWNGSLAALGTLLAAGNIITIAAAFVTAPFTSLCPVVGVGFVTGIVQAFVAKPKVSDMETLQDDAGSLKGFYTNRILKILLVFLLSSIGSSIGTFVGGADVLTNMIAALRG